MSNRSAEELLAHAGWLRGLALRLVRDNDIADDLVQETWMATMRGAPERRESAKSWLAKIMVNRLRMRARSEGRRTAREQAKMLLDDEIPTQDVLVARAEMQRKLVDLVLRLDEPYRTTVLLHFCEGVSLANIARTQGVPPSTVRWRLKSALDRLRDGLDAETGGRKQWGVPLLAIPKGVLVAHKTSKLVAVAIALLLLILVSVGLLVRHRGGGDSPRGRSAGVAAAGGGGAAPIALGVDADRPAWLIQPDVKPRRIAGKVTFRGVPVAGASVELASLASESGLGVAPRRTTTATGEFDFGMQPAMEFSVRASAPHRASAALDVDLRNPIVRADHLEVALGACDAALVGTVRDASGGPIAKARVAWIEAEADARDDRLDLRSRDTVPGGASVATDDSGTYELCVTTRWPNWVTVEVGAAGYGTILYTSIVPGRVKVDFTLVPEATIVGRVIREETRQPVAQAYVYVAAGSGGVSRTAWRAAFTDASGRFRIDRVAPGRHLVFARADGLTDSSRGVPIAVDAGQTSAEIEIRLDAGSTIRGRVVGANKPVAGARVAVGHATAFSQDDGSFVLTGVSRGEAKFTALPYDVVKPQVFRVSQPLHDGVVIEVEPLGTIVGRVLRNREPVVGAFVLLHGPNSRDLDRIRTDADGRFTARGLRAGSWDVGAGSEELGAFGGATQPVQLARGQTAEVTIDLVFAASISGRVVDQNGAPVPDVTVQFAHTSANDMGLAATATDGSFRAATMTGGGQYRPRVLRTLPSATPLKPASGTEFPLVTLADRDSAVTGIVLVVRIDRLSIAGMVVDGNGAPVSDIRVVAELVEGNAEPRFFQGVQAPVGITDGDGHFTIDDLLAGTYALRARSAAGVETTVVGVRTGRTDVRLVLPSPGAIDATLVGFKSAPHVTALSIGGRDSSAPIDGTVQGNVASFRNLSPGSYVVTADAASEGASAVVEVTTRRTSRVTLTSQGSGVVAGRVRDFRSGQPIEGVMCRALPRAGIVAAIGTPGEGVRTNAQGAFLLDAPGGDIAITCDGIGDRSSGLRLITLRASQRVDIDVPVVGWKDTTIASMGAKVDTRVLVPRLIDVQPGGPAATAGFQDGDVVTAVDGTSVLELSPEGVVILIRNRAPGTKVKLAAMRAGKTITGELVLTAAR